MFTSHWHHFSLRLFKKRHCIFHRIPKISRCFSRDTVEASEGWRSFTLKNRRQLKGMHVFFQRLHRACDELHWPSPCMFCDGPAPLLRLHEPIPARNIQPHYSKRCFLAIFKKYTLGPKSHSSWDENRSETTVWENYYLKPLSPATKGFKLNGNG